MSVQDITTLPEVCDLVVVGSGAAGMTAALVAKAQGLDVVILEKRARFGGTTALSGGVLWIPGHDLDPRTQTEDSPESARRYLRHELGNFYHSDMIDSYLTHGPQMLRYMRRFPSLSFSAIAIPDYHPESPGASSAPRALRPDPYDGRALGRDFAKLEPPIPEMMLWRRLSLDSLDAGHGFYALRSAKSLWHMAKLVTRGMISTIGQPRGTRLTNGNALAARLAKAVFAAGIPLHLETPMAGLLHEGGRVAGITLPDGRWLRARRGVILATGGMSRNKARMSAHLPQAAQHHSIAGSGSTGDGVEAALRQGATLEAQVAQAAAFVPVSLVPQADGALTPFPQLVERAKPGFLIVDHHGQRFTDESASYHDVVIAMNAVLAREPDARFHVIGDHRAVRHYGIGAVPPAPLPLGKWLANGYLKRAASLEDLAAALHLQPSALWQTVERYNEGARRGDDPDHGRGSTIYTRFMGDGRAKGHPNIAPLDAAPFYGVRIYPGDLGSMVGLRTDPHARVLDQNGQSIVGLWAVGNDMASVVRGTYPGAGVTLGPGMTFAYLAALDAARP